MSLRPESKPTFDPDQSEQYGTLLAAGRSLPVLPAERTFAGRVGMSQRCQKRKSAARITARRGLCSCRIGVVQPAVFVQAARSKSTIKSRVIGTASRLVDSSN